VNAEAHDAHLSRLREDDVPVSGRSEPRPVPVTAHDVRFHGARDGYGIVAYCDPCDWSVRLDDGHTLSDLTELKRQHCGEPPAVPSPLGVRLCEHTAAGLTCDLPYGHYAHHHASYNGHSISWPRGDDGSQPCYGATCPSGPGLHARTGSCTEREPVFGTESAPGGDQR
jgi:hypothetical protein